MHISHASISATSTLHDALMSSRVCPSVEISLAHAARRRATAWRGVSAEVVHFTRPGEVTTRFQAPVHLLAAYEQGVRHDGETRLDGAPRSTLKDLRRKLIFVPAGHRYEDRTEHRVAPRITYFYLDPAGFPDYATGDRECDGPLPRLFFDDPGLWNTIAKLNTVIAGSDGDDELYLGALGRVLVHELARLHRGVRAPKTQARGGLASWQQRVVVEHIETHLSETLQLAQLAELVHLSPQHFCRAFKQSLGLPPVRYHGSRRIERAKLPLAQAVLPVTEIGLTLGYSETSSFSAAFRRATGLTPTAYRRGLV
ncbi:MAG TPA: AraC family transcriptional regulator [Acetobacteraceae bacterium]|nr:AraC family transcriptional regulator [Acetobacteraceae bacterium]